MLRLMRVMAVSAASLALVAAVPQVGVGAPAPSVRGKATADYEYKVNVRQTGPGTEAVGRFSIVDAGWGVVTVDQMTLPDPTRDYFCVSGTNSEGDGVSLYVRDVGDGRTTYDSVTFMGGEDVTCADSPQFDWEAVTSGDFRTRS